MIWILIAAATVAVVAGSAFVLHRAGLLTPPPAEGGGAAAPGTAVAVDDHYLVYLSLIEVEDRNANGGGWDPGDDGPDLRYDVSWRGNRIFRSSVQKDTLIARWDQGELGIRDLVDGISPARASKAARVTVKPGETLEFRVVDDDTMKDDEIAAWTVAVDSLHVGDQTWTRPASGILRATCVVVRPGH